MSRDFHSFRERRDFLLYTVLAAAGFFVQQTDGYPIPGAWVGSSGSWFGFTDSEGYYRYTEAEPDTLTVHATGFADWTGVQPGNGSSVKLAESVFSTGECIQVTATRGSLLNTVPSTVVLLKDELAELSTEGMESLNGRVPGVIVREYGGSMPVVSISMRGGDPSQVDQMVNGVSITSARDGLPTGLFDPAVFSSVEVSRGGASGVGRGSGSSGSVNYLPPLSSQPPVFTVTSLSSGGVYFAGKYRGYALSLRRNTGVSGTVGYSTTLLATGRYSSARYGFLGAAASGDVEGPLWSAESDGNRLQQQMECWTTVSEGKFEFGINGGVGRMKYTQTAPFSADDTHEDLRAGASAVWNGPVTVKSCLSGTWLNSTSTDNHSVVSGILNASGEIGVFRGNLGCMVEDDGTLHYSGRATVTEKFFSNDFTAHTSVFTDYRVPTVNDLYWPADGYVSGNPYLRIERSAGAEAGLKLNTELLFSDVCLFWTDSRDLITWLPGATGVWSPSNVSSSLSRGIEFSTGFNTGFTSLRGTVSWIIATDETENTPREGMLLPYRPEYTWGVDAETHAIWSIVLKTGLAGMGKRFTDRTQNEYLSEYTVADFSAGRQLSGTTAVEVGIRNAFDTAYQETNGFPGPRRTFRLTLEYTGE
jgi:outer membrane cobalamin receptor